MGDKILAGVGNLLQSNLRKSDVACRYGGEEFILIMPGAPLNILQQRAEEIRADIGNLNITHKGETFSEITVSVGVAACPLHADSAEQLVKAADDALYEAKHTGRNKVIVAREIHKRSTGEFSSSKVRSVASA